MIIRRNEPMLIAGHWADCVEELIAAPRPNAVAKSDKAPRLGYVSLFGFIDPDYLDELSAELARLTPPEICDAVVIWIDSGGGYYTGTPEFAERVRRLAAVKPIYVIVVGYCCSGAYWIASQATHIFASPSAILGSINAYVVLLDSSEALKRNGLKVLRIAGASGILKGHPTPGVEIPDEFVAMIQNSCNYIALKFLVDVQRGRKLSDKEGRQLATGEVWHAEIAKTSKLVDEVALPEDVLAKIQSGLPSPKPAERFTNLSGFAAEQKLDDLATERFGIDFFADLQLAQQSELRREFPTLVSVVEAL